MLSEKELNEVSQMIQHRLADDAAWVLIVVPRGGTVTVASKVASRTEQLRMLIDGG